MIITIIATLMIMAGYFLLLYGVVGFIQDKKFFSSAPKENLAVIPKKKERFRGAHIIGGFIKFFVRFLIMLYVMEIYDIVFFDWVLLCHSNFFPHFYPELKGIVGPHMFGYNKKSHIIHFIIYIPICVAIAWIGTLF